MSITVGPVIPLLESEIERMKTMSKEELQDTPLYKIIRPGYKSLPLDIYIKILNRMFGLDPHRDVHIDLPDVIVEKFKFDVNKMFPSKPVPYWDLIINTSKGNISADTFKTVVDNIKPYTEVVDVCIPDIMKTKGVVSIATTALFLFMAKYYEKLDFPPFLFANVGDNANDEDCVAMLLNVFLQSRFNYILTGKYLPIVVYDGMISKYTVHRTVNYCNHAAMCVYLPSSHPNSTISTWNRIFIDSSAASYVPCGESLNKYNMWENTALQKYKMAIYHAQNDTDIQINQIFCIGNVQKNYPTCAHWSTILALLFVYNYEYLIDKLNRDPIYLTQWFIQLSNSTDKNMEHFLKIFLSIRKVFYSHFMHVLEHMDPELDEEHKDEETYIPNVGSFIELFLSGVLFGVVDQYGFKSNAETDATEEEGIAEMIEEVKSLFSSVFTDMERIVKLKYSAHRERSAARTEVIEDEERHISPVPISEEIKENLAEPSGIDIPPRRSSNKRRKSSPSPSAKPLRPSPSAKRRQPNPSQRRK